MTRPKRKTEVATIKLTPQVRAHWETAATLEHRSLANMFEVAILEYCRLRDIRPEIEGAELTNIL